MLYEELGEILIEKMKLHFNAVLVDSSTAKRSRHHTGDQLKLEWEGVDSAESRRIALKIVTWLKTSLGEFDHKASIKLVESGQLTQLYLFNLSLSTEKIAMLINEDERLLLKVLKTIPLAEDGSDKFKGTYKVRYNATDTPDHVTLYWDKISNGILVLGKIARVFGKQFDSEGVECCNFDEGTQLQAELTIRLTPRLREYLDSAEWKAAVRELYTEIDESLHLMGETSRVITSMSSEMIKRGGGLYLDIAPGG